MFNLIGAAVVACAATIAAAAELFPAEPFPLNPRGEWRFHHVHGTECMSGKETGVWLKSGDPKKLMVYHDQGGACFNSLTCVAAAATAKPSKPKDIGLFSNDKRNPAADFTIVFIPYCTGDVFAGETASQFALKYRHFAGHGNEKLIMDRVKATLPEITDLLVTGESAGGFGSAVNYDFIRNFYPDPSVRGTLVDDSGPIFSNAYLATCLQDKFLNTWNYTESLPRDCPCTSPESGLDTIWPTLKKNWPNDSLGLISSLNDIVISAFFAFGLNNCDTILPIGYNKIGAGLKDLARKFKGSLSVYMIPGATHTHSTNGDFFQKASAGVALTEWYRELMAGKEPASVDPDTPESESLEAIDYTYSNDVQLIRMIDAYNRQQDDGVQNL